MGYFNNIGTLDELKKEYKKLARQYHPDMGGNLEDMQKINAEFDKLFKIYQSRPIAEETETAETAESFRSEFYTQNGWKGSKYDETRHLSVVEVAKLIRKDLKAEFPECKFSVTTESASMCREIYVSLMESPYPAYMTKEEIIEARKDSTLWNDYSHPLNKHHHITVNGRYYDCNFMTNFTEQRGLTDEETEVFCNTANVPTEKMTSILKKVDAIVSSYNREDCDGMIDYFDVRFYYFDCKIGKWDKEYVCNPERAKKIKQKKVKTSVKTDIKENENENTVAEEVTETTISVENKEIKIIVSDDIDTRDNTEIKVVKLVDKLSKDDFNVVRAYFKSVGGYYSRFKRGFIFTELPETIALQGNESIAENCNTINIIESDTNNDTNNAEKMEDIKPTAEDNRPKQKYISKEKCITVIKLLAYMIYCNNTRRKYHCRI